MTETHAALLKSLADPTRLAIYERLCRNGEQTVGVLTTHAGVSQPAVSKHLSILKPSPSSVNSRIRPKSSGAR